MFWDPMTDQSAHSRRSWDRHRIGSMTYLTLGNSAAVKIGSTGLGRVALNPKGIKTLKKLLMCTVKGMQSRSFQICWLSKVSKAGSGS